MRNSSRVPPGGLTNLEQHDSADHDILSLLEGYRRAEGEATLVANSGRVDSVPDIEDSTAVYPEQDFTVPLAEPLLLWRAP